jgi:methylthioribose-1-phosphate isomerase
MNVNNKHYRTIWINEKSPKTVRIIDQRGLPNKFIVETINSVEQMAVAISDMHLRGAGLIGVAGAFGMYLAVLEASRGNSFDKRLKAFADRLQRTRPTAINLTWAIQRQLNAIRNVHSMADKINTSLETAHLIANEDIASCLEIGKHGFSLLKKIASRKKKGPLNILTHCNAGWLAFVDYGTATAPIYLAHEKGLNLHVWVDETRPRNQGSKLTAWELQQHGVPHTVIADNTGGHLMQQGLVDVVIVGSDRVTADGHVTNKIGTYLKALAAHDNGVPFYAAFPSSTFDWKTKNMRDIPIEERDPREVKMIEGWRNNKQVEVALTPKNSPAANYGFDTTPNRLVTGLLTERGLCNANRKSIARLFPQHGA